MTAQEKGRIVWHELQTTDTAAAERFYKSITIWSVVPFEHTPAYREWTAGGVPQGGLMILPEAAKQMGAPPNWLTYIGVPDVDATVRQATSLGASTYVAPQDIPNTGRFAVLADPQGAVFAVYTAAQAGNPETDPKVGEFSWHELVTTDQDAAWTFYSTLFGWAKQDAMPMGEMGVYQMFGRDRFMYGGMYNGAKAMSAPPHWLPYILVSSVDRVLKKISAGGGKILNGPMDVPGGDRVVVCMDPQGAAFALHSKGVAAAAPAPTAKPKAKSKPKVKAKTKPKAKAKTKPKAKAKPKAKSKPKARAKSKPRAKPKKKARSKK